MIAPVDVLGSHFPVWLICLVSGGVLTVIAYMLFGAWKIHSQNWVASIVYLCLTAIYALTIWALVFQP